MQALSLSQFAMLIGESVRRCPGLQGAWVTAEMSDVRASGGHIYMELLEKDAAGTTVAKMRANLWAGKAMELRRKFYAATGRDIGNGLKVMLRGSATHHPVYGLSFNIVDIDPSYTLGDMERLRREILERLKREGLLDMNRSLELPLAPQRVAVISASGAAGYGDFTDQLASSAEGFVFYPLLFGAVMQGERTSRSVRDALVRISESVDFWDVVVIIRGGGATTDLNGFDDYDLARAVATFPLPVIVGIGHERDRTVLDDIAAVRCKTPTAVAAWLVDRLREASELAYRAGERILDYALERMQGELRRIYLLESALPSTVGARLSAERLMLQKMLSGLPAAASRKSAYENGRLQLMKERIIDAAGMRLREAATLLRDRSDECGETAVDLLSRAKERLENMEKTVSILSPASTLARGFSITRLDGKALRDSSGLAPGTRIETTLSSGTVCSEIL